MGSHPSSETANQHSVVIIASRQTHPDRSVNEEEKLLGSERESQADVSNHDDAGRSNEQLPRSVVIIASTSSSPSSVRSLTPSRGSGSQQSSELVPSKLLSLSLSLLVAAFFQAIRCLTEFIEDTFRTLHCELDME